MPRTLSYLEAIGEALSQELDRDPSVFLLGEDNIGGTGCEGKLGNAWGPTKGLHVRFPDRILDTPITEAAFVGAAVGAAATGMRPVVDLLFVDFMGVCFDQLLNQAAKLRYMVGGKASVPMVVRAMWGAGMRRGAQHSQALYPMLAHVPGLKVVVPAFPDDAKGLMTAAIRDDDPVMFFEHKMLYFSRGPVPEESYEIPLGKARVVRPGTDCTIVAVGRMVHEALAAAELLAESGSADCEVIDPRTISPLDTETICASVARTGRLLVVDEANRRCGFAADVASVVAESAFDELRQPIQILTPPHTPTPFSPALEDAYAPTRTQVVDAVLSGARERARA